MIKCEKIKNERVQLLKDPIALSELLLGIFKKEPTPPLCSEEGAKVFCHRAIQRFNRNCLIFLILEDKSNITLTKE